MPGLFPAAAVSAVVVVLAAGADDEVVAVAAAVSGGVSAAFTVPHAPTTRAAMTRLATDRAFLINIKVVQQMAYGISRWSRTG